MPVDITLKFLVFFFVNYLFLLILYGILSLFQKTLVCRTQSSNNSMLKKTEKIQPKYREITSLNPQFNSSASL